MGKIGRSGDVITHSRLQMMELRRDKVRHYAGQYMHYLKKVKGGYRITLQRVNISARKRRKTISARCG